VTNYFIGNDRRKWLTRIPSYARIEYRNVYPRISLIYHGTQGHVEYDLVLAPGANPHAIRLAVEGAQRFYFDARGNLVMWTDSCRDRLSSAQAAGIKVQQAVAAGSSQWAVAPPRECRDKSAAP
jgi:hypothetical protein